MGYVEGMCTVQCSGLYCAETQSLRCIPHALEADAVPPWVSRRNVGAIETWPRAARVVGGACTGYLDVLTGRTSIANLQP